MTEPLIQVQNVSLKLGKSLILKKINFEVHAGECFAVIGHNGAGKTSIFHLLMGFKFASEGEAFLFGQPVEDAMARKKVGYVSERPYVSMESSLQELLELLGGLNGLSPPQVKEKASSFLKRFGLEGAYRKKLKHFSKGMLQKALLIQALLHDPELLIFDEPMSGLDPESREELKKFMQEWKAQGRTLIFSSHTLEDVEALADRVLKLSNGEVVA